MSQKKYKNIDEYISDFNPDVSNILTKIRNCIRETAPEAVEAISYNMPAFKQNKKVLVYFAAFKHHIGLYALPSGNIAFQKELTNYKTGKGSIQFPLDKEMPFNLIKKIVTFRIQEVTS